MIDLTVLGREDQPREPAGSPEGGQFASTTMGRSDLDDLLTEKEPSDYPAFFKEHGISVLATTESLNKSYTAYTVVLKPEPSSLGRHAKGNEIFVVEDGETTPVEATEWVTRERLETWVEEPDFNADFWTNPSSLYHRTTEDHAESIDRNGLEARRETRGLTNRGTGSAVFTSTDPEANDAYGDVVYEIDMPSMKRDGYTPNVASETAASENQLREQLAWKIGLRDYSSEDYDDPGAADERTVVISGHIPKKYLLRDNVGRSQNVYVFGDIPTKYLRRLEAVEVRALGGPGSGRYPNAFKPTQIKSAISNTTYDKTNPLITASALTSVTLPLPPHRAARLLARLVALGKADQPRDPAGTSTGGQWSATNGGKTVDGKKKKKKGENITGVSDTANDSVVEEVLGTSDVRDLAESMVQYADENFEVEITTEGSGERDSDQLDEEYQAFHDAQVADHRNEFVGEIKSRGTEVDEIWAEMQAEELTNSPYGDVSDHPTLPDDLGFDRTKNFVPFGDVVADLDTTAPFNDDEKETIRERLRGSAGPQQVTTGYARSMYNEQYEDTSDIGDSYDSWLQDQPSSDSGDQKVSIAFRGDNGTNIEREFMRQDGELVVDHAYFSVASKARNKGTATEVLRGSFEAYEQLGVDRVGVHANIDIGGYAWAKFGFKPNHPQNVNQYLRRRVESFLEGAELEAARAALKIEDDEAIWRLADTKINGVKVGFKVLKATDWYGHIDLSDKVAMGRLHAYLNRDRSKEKRSIPTETVTPQAQQVVPPLSPQVQKIVDKYQRTRVKPIPGSYTPLAKRSFENDRLAQIANRKRLGLSVKHLEAGSNEMFYDLEDGTRADIDLWKDLLGPEEFDGLRTAEFDESQPRDPDGKWTDGGDYSSLKTMPSHIDGVSIEKKLLSSSTMLAIGGSSGIAVNTSRRAATAWKDMAAYQKRAFESGWSSSSHPNHVIWHELAHVRVKNDDPDRESYRTNTNSSSNPTWAAVAKTVSKYAATNGQEFVAEVYAAVRAGRKFDDTVLRFYKMLGGPAL